METERVHRGSYGDSKTMRNWETNVQGNGDSSKKKR
jgi:hypothetical protein